MKRILVRMSALATVVVLGLTAIVQAQRSGEDPSSTTTAGTGSHAAGAAASSPLRSVDATREPGRFPGADGANPLRTGTGRTSPGTAVHASGEVIERASESSTLGGPQPDTPTNDGPVVPFPAGGGSAAAIQGSAAEGASNAIDFPAGTSSAEIGQDAAGYEELPDLSRPPSATTAEPNDHTPLEDAGRNPYLSESGRGSATAAPRAFNPDPGFPTASLPEAREASPSGLVDRYVGGRSAGYQDVAPTGSNLPGQGTGTPGTSKLEGPQAPQLTLEKFAPSGVKVGESATFRVLLRNTGSVAAHDVEIQDLIPKGTRLLNTDPPASQGVGGELIWSVGTMNPGDETSIDIELMPVEEGEIGSVATVRFSADATAKTTATKPVLVLKTSAPREVLIGDQLLLKITISNPGSGVATGVVLEERVPAGLQHSEGPDLEYVVGDLQPGETRELELPLMAAQAGPVTNVLTARGEPDLKTVDQVELDILAPDLAVRTDGPTKRYLEREATYTFSVANPGTAPAKNVDLVAYLPHGLDFVRANNAGYYDESSRTVRWRLAELPVAEQGSVQLTTVPTEAGEHALRLVGSTPAGLSVEQEHPVRVEGIAALLFEVVDLDDPIELGGETTYEIRVVNQGSKAATNVRVAAALPPRMRPVAAEGPPGIEHTIEGSNVVFESLARLAPKADTTYRVRAQGLEPGDLRVNVQVIADELQDWVTKQESTRVYSDE